MLIILLVDPGQCLGIQSIIWIQNRQYLALSYFDPYVDLTGRVQGYAVASLLELGSYDWRYSEKNVWHVEQFLEGPAESRLVSESRPTTSQILDSLQFMKELSSEITLPRPKSRAFLDHLENVSRDFAPNPPEEPRLIVPA